MLNWIKNSGLLAAFLVSCEQKYQIAQLKKKKSYSANFKRKKKLDTIFVRAFDISSRDNDNKRDA